MGFEVKEGKIEKELVHRFNIKLLQGQMMMCAKVVATMWHQLMTTRASALVASTGFSKVLFKFVTSEDHQATLWGRRGLARTKLHLDENLTPTQQVRKLELWPLFKEAKTIGKHTL